MARKRIHTVTSFGRTVKVYRDSEWLEYVARLYVNGELVAGADYHTDCRRDAIDTAGEMVAGPVPVAFR